MIETLNRLHATATETRDLAHQAYVVALKSHDSDKAYGTLLAANVTRDAIYSALLAEIVR
jgi:hypothetical protein